MSEEVLIARRGEILDITLNAPERGNAASDAMAIRLGDILEAETQARCIILRGAGDDFCTGRASGPPPQPLPDAHQLRVMHDIVFRAYGAVRKSPAPVIALIQGRALGFGCALAAVADITIASQRATFQVPEFAHNIMPTMVMSSMIDRLSLKAIMYLVYTSKIIGAEQALSLGLVNEIVAPDQLESSAETLCASLLKASRPAVFGVKEYAMQAQGADIATAVSYARSLHALVNTSGDLRANFKKP